MVVSRLPTWWKRWRRRRVLRRNASGYRAALRGLLELAADG